MIAYFKLLIISGKLISFYSAESSYVKKRSRDQLLQKKANLGRVKRETMVAWPGLLEAWLAPTSVKYHGNL